MKKYMFIAVVGLMIGSTALAAPSKILKQGGCKLQEAGPFDKNKSFILDLKNSDIRVIFNLKGEKFFGKFVIQTTPRISNFSEKPKHVAYNIAFFDKNAKLIACTSSSADLKKNEKDLQASSNMPEIPRSDLEKITSYQVVVYVSDSKKE